MLGSRRKYRRDLRDIGKRKYNFDVKLEKKIYSYVSCYKMKRLTRNRLNDELKFDSYKKWKNYVLSKYNLYSDETLEEFSRYLNQEIRNVKSTYDYWKMVVPVMLTLMITKIFEILMGMKYEVVSENSILSIIGFVIAVGIVIALVFALGVFLVKQTIEPLIESDIENYLYIDYKEIIDEMIIFRKHNLDEDKKQ